ncbi:MAG TPA: hypothetical protein VNH18_25985 [Bryobacteraceae bacterium]|nr:hypothetical protein [Bryobacteraceae bacterium]
MPSFVTIVSGLPRSGTSLMMQMLEAGGIPALVDGIREPDQNNPRGYYEFEPVKRTRYDAQWLERARGKAVKVIYALLRDLPPGYDYRVVLMHREPEEVLSSQSLMLRGMGTTGSMMPPDRLAAAFAADLSSVLEELGRRAEFRILNVEHRECLCNPAAVAAQLSAFLGVDLDAGRMAAVPDETLYRRRAYQPNRS